MILLLIGVGSGAPARASGQDAEWRYQRLDLTVAIEPSSARLEIQGHGVFEVIAGVATELPLGVNTRMPALRFEHVTTPRVGSQVEIVAEPPLHRARIVLDRPLTRGDNIEVEFKLIWSAPSSQLILRDSIALASWVEAWYPIPLGAGDAMRQWAAPGRTRFHLPPGWRAVTNGRLLSSELGDDSSSVEVWEATEPVHRSFAAGPYRVARTSSGGRDFGVYLLRADTAAARRQAAVLEQAIAAMERVWGPYPYAGYAIAEVPDSAVTWGASSEQGFIMATTQQFGASGNLPLFAHEAAHAWWGNRVSTTGAGSQLVSESLAQYGAVLAIEAIEGTDAMNEFLRYSRTGYNQFQSAHGYFEIIRRGGDKPLAELSNGQWDHDLADSKGHWFYHMLRHRVGGDLFFGVLRALQRDFAGRAMALDDVRAAFAHAVPADPDLPQFMAQWLDRTGAPVLDHSWWATGRGRVAQLRIRQTQPSLYDLAVEVEIELLNGHRVRRTVRLTEREQTFDLPVHARPVDLRIDPDYRLLHWRPEYGPPPSVEG
ncbi:MAG TPA: M1 family aminopeptidase [Longimicrobiales bacterium]|nr:M1 family aminopeptidase [Longimicrobiales bacterium]